MKKYDAIVVGAGPAGSTTAYRLASAGASVLLLDRARFPRDKPCGGGLTVRALKALPVRVDPVVEVEIDRFEFGFRSRSRFERSSPAPLVAMTQRSRLDAYLAEQAAAAGADFRDGTRVTALEAGPEEVEVTAGGTRFGAELLVGADGANGVTAKALGLGRLREVGVALEGNLAYDELLAERYDRRALVELGTVPGGYGWIFPKGDHANVGVGGWERMGPELRRSLARFCRAYGLDVERLTGVRGFRLPLRAAGSSVARGRALVAGDAAGLVDPLSGDGMYEAFVSSRLAADAALDLLAGRTSDLSGYDATLAARFDAEHAASYKAKLAFDRFPALAYRVARMRLAWRLFEQVVHGDQYGMEHGPTAVPARLLKTLARAA